MVVYSVYAVDNGSHAFRGVQVERCSSCNMILNKWTQPLSEEQISVGGLEISFTYDGVLVGSLRFLTRCRSLGVSSLVGHEIRGPNRLFSLSSTNIVEFDSERRRTRFSDRCELCTRFRVVVGATPVFLRAGAIVDPQSFARTDLEFGTGDEQHPLLLCGEAVGRKLAKLNISGLELKAWSQA